MYLFQHYFNVLIYILKCRLSLKFHPSIFAESPLTKMADSIKHQMTFATMKSRQILIHTMYFHFQNTDIFLSRSSLSNPEFRSIRPQDQKHISMVVWKCSLEQAAMLELGAKQGRCRVLGLCYGIGPLSCGGFDKGLRRAWTCKWGSFYEDWVVWSHYFHWEFGDGFGERWRLVEWGWHLW